MSTFTEAERAYLAEVTALGRLATVDASGQPRVVPLGWRHNPEDDTIELSGRDAAEFAATRKFRDVRDNPKVAFIVDDVLPPWHPRAVIVHGLAEAIHVPATEGVEEVAMIRITPTATISWGLDDR